MAESYNDFPKNLALLAVNFTHFSDDTKMKDSFYSDTPKTLSRNKELDSAKSTSPKYNYQYNCIKHDKKYEAFCQNDRSLICIDCILEDDHKAHEMVSISKALEKDNIFNKTSLEAA